jgi:hypothetical protein
MLIVLSARLLPLILMHTQYTCKGYQTSRLMAGQIDSSQVESARSASSELFQRSAIECFSQLMAYSFPLRDPKRNKYTAKHRRVQLT